jgi:hypothetical protein
VIDSLVNSRSTLIPGGVELKVVARSKNVADEGYRARIGRLTLTKRYDGGIQNSMLKGACPDPPLGSPNLPRTTLAGVLGL